MGKSAARGGHAIPLHLEVSSHGLSLLQGTEGGSEIVEMLQAEGCRCVYWLLDLCSESYLRLGRAYIEDGQFNRALEAAKCAFLVTVGETLKCYYSEETLRKLVDLRDPKAAEFAWQMRRLTPPKEAFLPNVGVWDQA